MNAFAHPSTFSTHEKCTPLTDLGGALCSTNSSGGRINGVALHLKRLSSGQ